MRAAVNHAMSHKIDLGEGRKSTRLPADQRAQQMLDDLFSRRDLDLFFLHDSVRVLDRDGSGAAAKLDFALPQASRRMVWESRSNFVEAGLLAARTGVEYENLHRAPTVSTGQAAPLTTRYESVDRKRLVNLCVSGTASTIKSAEGSSASCKIRSLCVPTSAGSCGALVGALSGVPLASRSCHSNCDTFARTRPDRFSSTSTAVRRERYLRVSEKA